MMNFVIAQTAPLRSEGWDGFPQIDAGLADPSRPVMSGRQAVGRFIRLRLGAMNRWRRTLRALRAGAIILSAAGCVASLIMWVRSQSSFDQLTWTGPTERWILSSARGQLAFAVSGGADWSCEMGLRVTASPNPQSLTTAREAGWSDVRTYLERGGFVIWMARAEERFIRCAVVPWWSVVTLMLILPALRLVRTTRGTPKAGPLRPLRIRPPRDAGAVSGMRSDCRGWWMKRWIRSMLKFVGIGAIILSALLCVASLGMWVRSIFHGENLSYIGDRPEFINIGVESYKGIVAFGVITSPLPPSHVLNSRPGWEYGRSQQAILILDESFLGRHGFSYENGAPLESVPLHMFRITLPYWFTCMLFAVLPVLWMIRRRRHFPAGHCQTCGYDLRETPQRCLECGTTPRTGA
jgi:hypothetical protein